MIKTIIFDFDGTLTPLTLDFAILRSEILEVARRYAAEDLISRYEGYHIIEMIYAIEEGLCEKAGAGRFRKEAFELLRHIELAASQGKDVYSYTRDVLKSLKAKGIKIAIITRTCLDVVKSVFADMENFVNAVVTREDTRLVKPDPGHALEALRLLGALPEEAMMVGDHPTDVMGGRAAGMLTAGVLTGRTTVDAFQSAGADFILEDIRGLLHSGVFI